MTETEIQNILEKQHKFFQTGQTLPVNYRIEQLKKLKDSIIRHEPDLNLSLKADLGKSETESYMCEVGLTLSELSWMLKHIKKLTKEKWVPTPLAQFAAKSFRSPSPYGTVLIMSPWNYPVLLTLEPLIDALQPAIPLLLNQALMHQPPAVSCRRSSKNASPKNMLLS